MGGEGGESGPGPGRGGCSRNAGALPAGRLLTCLALSVRICCAVKMLSASALAAISSVLAWISLPVASTPASASTILEYRIRLESQISRSMAAKDSKSFSPAAVSNRSAASWPFQQAEPILLLQTCSCA